MKLEECCGSPKDFNWVRKVKRREERGRMLRSNESLRGMLRECRGLRVLSLRIVPSKTSCS